MKLSKDVIATIDYSYQIDEAYALELTQSMFLEILRNSYDKICLLMLKTLEILIKAILSHCLAAKYCCPLTAEEVDYLNTCKHVLLKSKQDKVKENKIAERHFLKINDSALKICALLLEKIQRKITDHKPNSIATLDSYNRANHLETEKLKINLVSFFSTIVNCNLL